MLTKTRRFALATAMLWFVFGAGGRAEAGGLSLSTPGGLTPGESFRFVFVTDGTDGAGSSDINYYNNFVTTQAGGATYNGSVVSWVAIGSTATVNAIDNVGQTPISGVYLADGTLVTTSTTSSGLWSGSLLNPINESLSGSPISYPTFIWTGTNPSGTAASSAVPPLFNIVPTPLGSSFGFTEYGFAGDPTSGWVAHNANDITSGVVYSMYGISQVLTVPGAVAVPEPSTLWMAASAICAGVAFRWSRRRRQQRR